MTEPAPTSRRPADASVDLGLLGTEGARADLADLDARPTRELVDLITAEDATVPGAVAAAAPALSAAVDAIADRLRRGGRLVYVGAGTPGRLALVDASECPPTFGSDPAQVQAVMAGGDSAMAEAAEGAEDDADAGAAAVEGLGVGPDDAVVGISASGRTPYVLAAVEAARAAGALTVGVACNPDAELSSHCDIAVEVVTGPEVLSGSTRMKAGTAQKLVLHTLSTATMVRLGKTYGNLMVDVRPTNEKLRARARRIVVAATGVDDRTAADALVAAGWHAKTAIVALLADVDVAEARERLERADGHVRSALAEGPGAGR